MRGRRGRRRGVVLLLTLMVVALLVVLVGQFAFSAVLDRKVARNHADHAQALFDLRSGAAAAAAYLGEEGRPPAEPLSLTLALEDAEIRVTLADEQGKFNPNALRRPPAGVSADRAAEAFDILADRADRPQGALPAGLAETVRSFVRESDTPVYTLRTLALEAARGGGAAGLPLEEDAGGADLGRLEGLLTVWTDGRVNPASAPDDVLAALAGVRGDLSESDAEALRRRLLDPDEDVPPAAARAAERAAPWMTGESLVCTALVETDRGGFGKKALFVLVKEEGGGFSAVLADERE